MCTCRPSVNATIKCQHHLDPIFLDAQGRDPAISCTYVASHTLYSCAGLRINSQSLTVVNNDNNKAPTVSAAGQTMVPLDWLAASPGAGRALPLAVAASTAWCCQ